MEKFKVNDWVKEKKSDISGRVVAVYENGIVCVDWYSDTLFPDPLSREDMFADQLELVKAAAANKIDVVMTYMIIGGWTLPVACEVLGVDMASNHDFTSVHTPPFSNCKFELCDLPGQCRSEGKCHHPAATPDGEAVACSAVIEQVREACKAACERQDRPRFSWKKGNETVAAYKQGLSDCAAAIGALDLSRYTRPAPVSHEKELEGWKDAAKSLQLQLNASNRELRLMRDYAAGNYWVWQGDGQDYPNSMANDLPVLIRADDLRNLLAAAGKGGAA